MIIRRRRRKRRTAFPSTSAKSVISLESPSVGRIRKGENSKL